jgi:phosphatidylethanolamine/phosphatidyl-N-methylethanolamine N-methyltransferase
MTPLKHFRPVPDHATLTDRWLKNYDKANYSGGLSGYVLKSTHSLIERDFGPDKIFRRVLEIGAGTLAHLPFVRHQYDEYVASDFDEGVVAQLMSRELPQKVRAIRLDGVKLPYDDDSFDRVIATHVLEHIPSPQASLAEWARIIRPGGVLSIILPCDPGMDWRLGRHFGPRAQAEKAGLPYDYYMAREHVNSILGFRLS